MGYWKEQQIQELGQGFYNPPEKYVCAKHFEDAFLQEFVKKNSVHGVCDYCDKKHKVLSLHEMVGFINERIKDRFTDLEDANLPLGNSWLDRDEESDDYLKEVGCYVLPKGEKT